MISRTKFPASSLSSVTGLARYRAAPLDATADIDNASSTMKRPLFFALALIAGCGAKTGLLIPDAGPDAGMDAGPDAGMDAGRCIPQPVALERRGGQVMFVIDRSNSMADTFDGRDPVGGEPTRWTLVGDVLGQVLADADPLLEVGGKFYPQFNLDPAGPEEACAVDEGVDLPPARGNADRLLGVFSTTSPAGGTPTAFALEEVRDFYARRPAANIPRFVILATDGGPNCNPDTGVSRFECVCTGQPDSCASPDAAEFGPYNCLDEARTIAAIEDIFGTHEIPVYVIGILDPTRPDLADVLDRMAVAGGRPREMPGEREFYDVGDPAELRGALMTITDSIAECVFVMQPAARETDIVTVSIDGVMIPRDTSRVDGWDFTTSERGEITLFGGACERVTRTGGEVIAHIECPPEP